jgi:hypothetical protein
MAAFREQRVYVKFCFKLGKAAPEAHKKKRSVTVLWREHQFLISFLYSDVGKTVEGDVEVVSLPNAQMETWSKLRKSPTKTGEVRFRTSLAG